MGYKYAVEGQPSVLANRFKKHPNELDGIEWPPNKERF
jgi:hypothetical protein